MIKIRVGDGLKAEAIRVLEAILSVAFEPGADSEGGTAAHADLVTEVNRDRGAEDDGNRADHEGYASHVHRGGLDLVRDSSALDGDLTMRGEDERALANKLSEVYVVVVYLQVEAKLNFGVHVAVVALQFSDHDVTTSRVPAVAGIPGQLIVVESLVRVVVTCREDFDDSHDSLHDCLDCLRYSLNAVPDAVENLLAPTPKEFPLPSAEVALGRGDIRPFDVILHLRSGVIVSCLKVTVRELRCLEGDLSVLEDVIVLGLR
mmetsp:Transcript_30966/g.61381  ORF Transcript_30966/g.61381 Transcript_30966/m.61381 type:complete len:261 (-) Transcript_30966:542-1324(-)